MINGREGKSPEGVPSSGGNHAFFRLLLQVGLMIDTAARVWTIVSLAIASLALPAVCVGNTAERPNVVLIMTDDQGYADMSCHGNPYVKTPNIDALHDEAVRFTDFHVDPTCSPTRAALMTGRYSSRVGVWLTYAGRHRPWPDELTAGDIFSANGYRTAVFGKWHLGDNYPYRPIDRGFQESLIHGGGVVGEAPDFWGNDTYDDVYVRNGTREAVRGYCTDVWFDEALRFVEENRDRPFFIYLPTNAAHGPHHVPWKYAEPYAELGERTARFFGMIANIDENIGRFRRKLDELGLAENTILIFLTDNGGTAGVRVYNAGMRGSKATAYEGGHRAACFIYWPAGGLYGGRDVDRVAAHFDLLPTLVDLCGLKLPRPVDFDGRSLAPLLKDPNAPWPDRTLFVHHQGRFNEPLIDDRPIKYKDFSVLTETWRLVGDGPEKRELYAIERDPGQQHDVAAEHPDVVARLMQAYEAWWDDISTRFDDYARVVVGSDAQPKTVLTCQQWHGERIPYSQQMVRQAMDAEGFWDLEVARPGRYRIALRRWPEELDVAIRDIVPPPELDPKKHAISAGYRAPSGRIDAVRARLAIGDFDETRPVGAHDREVVFEVDLPKGPVDLHAWFYDGAGKRWGVYYVVIERP